MSEVIEFYKGSRKLCVDLGPDNAGVLYTRAMIGFQVLTILKERKLKQREAAVLLNLKQPDVSMLMSGRFYRFSTERLLYFLRRLDQDITLTIRSRDTLSRHKNVCLPL